MYAGEGRLWGSAWDPHRKSVVVQKEAPRGTPRRKQVDVPRTGREIQRHTETVESEARCQGSRCSWMVVPSSLSLQGANAGVMHPRQPHHVSPLGQQKSSAHPACSVPVAL